jgi:sec-independent protein translocase protein TatA
MGVGGGQLLIIAVILVILFVAPARLPGLGKSLAQSIKGFKKGMADDDDDDETDVTTSVKREKLEDNSTEKVSKKAKQKEKV